MDIAPVIKTLKNGKNEYKMISIKGLNDMGYDVSKMPYSLRIILENILRRYDGKNVTEEHIKNIIYGKDEEIPFYPERIVLQDYTGIPVVLDLVAMRNALSRMNKDPGMVNPANPVHLIVDHSVQVDLFGTKYAMLENMRLEYQRNAERYTVLKWATKNFNKFNVVPPGNGIIHQVNTEYLSSIVITNDGYVFPETLLGTDSHTTMINGLGIVGWGVGGIEAEAVIVGEPTYITVPKVVGVKLINSPRPGVSSTDIVLTITQFLREKKVVGKFVEFIGPGLKNMSAQDRTTVANMAPEYGATMGYFPVDEETLRYLYLTGRKKSLINLIKNYMKNQGLFYDENNQITYSEVYEFDLSKVEPSIAGPKNPDERISLSSANQKMHDLAKELNMDSREPSIISINGRKVEFGNYSVVIAAITSCTNTSNPSVLIGAGILAKKAVENGLTVKPYVKTSFAPGSVVVDEYMEKSGLMPYLEALGFHIVAHGCTTCIGNSGPLIPEVEKTIREKDYYTAAVLSGNRNFEGRINVYVKGTFLASPILVVAYAIAGRIDIDFEREPIGYDPNGKAIYLKDIWPNNDEIKDYIMNYLDRDIYVEKYRNVFEGNSLWQSLSIPEGNMFRFDEKSTYIKEPPWFENFSETPPGIHEIRSARIIAIFGDNITTDHISPAGAIITDKSILEKIDLNNPETYKLVPPAAIYLLKNGVKPEDFNTYGSRRGNHEVMVRGGFSNPKIRNKMVDILGGFTKYYPGGEIMSIYDAAMKYRSQGIPLVIFAGKRYGQGSSRDWAAKATALLGIRAVIAENFERIHRSNLVDMGVIPIQIDVAVDSLNLKGDEIIDIKGIEDAQPKGKVKITINGQREIDGLLRIDTQAELEYVKHGGILQYTLRKMTK
ncbi:MAG: aconitate hydratase AcnA [Thermoplasmata archaeon]